MKRVYFLATFAVLAAVLVVAGACGSDKKNDSTKTDVDPHGCGCCIVGHGWPTYYGPKSECISDSNGTFRSDVSMSDCESGKYGIFEGYPIPAECCPGHYTGSGGNCN
jgi:hypothetical protein